MAFPVIGQHLARKVGNGEKVKFDVDTILGCGGNLELPDYMINSLQDRGFYTLYYVKGLTSTDIRSQFSRMEAVPSPGV